MSSIKKNFIYNVFLSLSQVIFPLLIFPHLARIILPAGIGAVSFVENFCRYFMLLSALGIPLYGVREIAKSNSDKSKQAKIFFELVLVHLVFTFLSSIIYFVIIFHVNQLYQYYDYYLVGSLMLFSNVFMVEWFFQGIENFKFITIRNLFIRLILMACVYIFIREKSDAFLYFLFTCLVSFVNAFINFSKALHYFKGVKFKIALSSIIKHLKPLVLIFSSIVFISLYTLMDTIILGFLANEDSVGFYNMAMKIARVPMLFIGALGVVLVPKLSDAIKTNNIILFNNFIQKSISFVFTIAIPTTFFIITCSDEIILVFAGSNFLASSKILKILSVLGILVGLSNIFGLQILTPMSKDKYLTLAVFFGTVISLALNFILIPILKEFGAAISNIIAELVVTFCTILFASKFIKVKFDFKFLLFNILSSLPILFIYNFLSFLHLSAITVLCITTILYIPLFIIIQIYLIKNSHIIELSKKINFF